jgi:hypothetical protein
VTNVTCTEDDVGAKSARVAAADAVADAERAQQAGRLAGSRRRFTTALDVARDAADAELFARSALGLGGVWVHEHRSAVERAHVIATQREACTLLADNAPLRVRLETRVAAEMSYASGDATDVLAAVDRARAAGHPVALAEALSLAHHCLLGPAHAQTRRELADELIEVSAHTGRSLDANMGLLWRTVDQFLSGDVNADRSLEQLRARDLEDCVRYVVLALGVMQAIRAGDLDDAERLAHECHQFGVHVGDADALGWFGAHIVLIRWLQGRGGELISFLDELRESPTLAESNRAFDAAYAVLAASADLPYESRAALQRLRARGLATLQNSSTWLVTMCGVVEAAYLLDDEATARDAYELLLPFADLPIMASLAIACFGSVHRSLGLAASTFGDHDLAISHLEAAAANDLAFAHRPAVALSCAALANALERRGTPADTRRVLELRASAADTARHCGMTRRADAWSTTDSSAPVVECSRDGRMWRLRVDKQSVVVADSIGMRYLARLLVAPGVEIPAVDLAGRTIESSRPQELVDADALAAYRRRAYELQAEIEQAEDHADLERAAHARLEFDALIEEIRRATGLAGKHRSFANEGERARTSVQKAIKRALARISEADAHIARALEARIVTGTHCVYLPARAT